MHNTNDEINSLRGQHRMFLDDYAKVFARWVQALDVPPEDATDDVFLKCMLAIILREKAQQVEMVEEIVHRMTFNKAQAT